ncbi:MAG: DUF11 domain-containing protein, partial [Thermoplasmata archaeon]|nr:DUF11 domain-containing protein [Thermoplasmata archaeon]
IGDWSYSNILVGGNQDNYPLMEPLGQIVNNPDITVSKVVDKAIAAPEELLTYTIYFDNAGTSNADFVWINDTLPANVTYISDTANSLPEYVSSGLNGQSLWFNFTNVAPGNHSFMITVIIDTGVPYSAIISNYVTCDYSPSGVHTDDWASTTVIGSVIAIEKVVDKESAEPEELLTYTVYYNNTGSGTATDVWINDSLPSGVTYIADSSGEVPTVIGNNFSWYFINIVPGPHMFTIFVQIDTGVPNGTVLTNWVTCEYEPSGVYTENWASTTIGMAGPDFYIHQDDISFSNPAPSQWEEIMISVEVHSNDWVEEPAVDVVKIVDKELAPQGELLNYTIFYNNTGPDVIDLVTITDELHPGVTYVASTLPPTYIFGQTFIWNITNVSPGFYSFILTVVINLVAANGTLIDNHVTCNYTPNGIFSEGWAYTTVGDTPSVIPSPGETEDGAYCTVSFYLDSIISGNLIYREYEVFIPNNGSTLVSYDWLVDVSGNHTIIVNITDSNPPEDDLLNNMAMKPLFIDEPNGYMKVKASSDKQKYESGVDDKADIIIKVTYHGQPIEGAMVNATVIDPTYSNTVVMVTEQYPGKYVGEYWFTNTSEPGTYKISVMVTKIGYLTSYNNNNNSKFFLDTPIPTVSSVTLSTNTPGQDSDVTIYAALGDLTGGESINAILASHGDKYADVSLPLYDDGTHSDAIPGDGMFTSVFSTSGMSDTYVTDIVINEEIVIENQAVLVVAPSDMVSIDTITYLETTGNTLTVNSPATNLTLEIRTLVDITGISFSIVEHITVSEGKTIDIIPSSNINTAMTNATIQMSYNASDVPAGTNESDMRIYVWNPETGNLEPLEGDVDTDGDVISGDTEHFSEFVFVHSVDLMLETGWNLISFPLLPVDTSITQLFSQIDGYWEEARYYDASDMDDHWKTYNVNYPGTQDLLNVDNTMAIWVKVNSPVGLKAPGTVQEHTNINLHAGWNFVGYPSCKAGYTVADLKMDTGADIVEAFNSSALYSTSVLADDYVLENKAGYWIHMPASTTWIIDWE